MMQPSRRSWLFVFPFDHPAQRLYCPGTRGNFGLGRLSQALHIPRSSGPCTWITLTQSRVIMSELRVVYPLTFVLGVFLFSFWLFDESYVSLKEWGFFCVNQGYIYPWPLNWLFKILLLLIWINIFWTIMWPLTIAKNSSRALADVDFFL